MKYNDEMYMRRCLDLARNGAGCVSPNPMVGCVIVRNGKIVGEGFHQQFGGPHAEVYALLHAGRKAKGATLYVNLEPCVHFGKTPPCVDAIIKAGISSVIIGTKDPNPSVAGKGIRLLRNAGIKVKLGVLRVDAEILNEKFMKFMRTGLPYVGIKVAQTLDGFIADKSGESKWITSEIARMEAHRIRSYYDAVMVGAGTVLKDDPKLTVRLVKGRNPVRIVIDGKMSTPVSCKIFDTVDAPTWILTSSQAMKTKNEKVHKLAEKGIRVIAISPAFNLNSKSILSYLGAEGISSVLIEGGANLISNFIDPLFADKLYLFTAPKIIGSGLNGLQLKKARFIDKPIKIETKQALPIGEDFFVEANFYNN